MASNLKSITIYAGNNTTGPWEITFAGVHPDDSTAPYIKVADVYGFIVTPATSTMPAIFEPVALVPQGGGTSPSTFRTAIPVPVGKDVWLRRITESDFALVDFHRVVTVTSNDLDTSARQSLFLAQEATDAAALALDAGNGARTGAYQAIAIAQLALEEADNASSLAGNALNTAALASLRADQAEIAAAAAVAAANTATTTAGNAVTTANSATTTANAASAAAATAVSTANSASTTANTANTKADTAIASSATATTTANTANTKADAAVATANTAGTKADTAVADAAGAVATANAAQATANGIDAKATEALDTANEAKVTADAAMAAVQDAGVQTWNGRSGVVVPVAGDYSEVQVSYGGTDVATTLANHAGAINNRVVVSTTPGYLYGTDPTTGAPQMYQISIGSTNGTVVRRDVDGSVAGRGLVLNNLTSPPAGHYGLYSHPSGVSLGTGTSSFLFRQDGSLTAKQVVVETLGVSSNALVGTARINSLEVLDPIDGVHKPVYPGSGAPQLVTLWTGPTAAGTGSLTFANTDVLLWDEIVVEFSTATGATPQRYRASLGQVYAKPLGSSRLSTDSQNISFTYANASTNVNVTAVNGGTNLVIYNIFAYRG